MKKYFKKLISVMLVLSLTVTMLPIYGISNTVSAATHTLQNPTKNSSGDTVWDCVWFGSYPQAEVIPSGTYSALSSSLLQDGDTIVSDSLYNQLKSATGWSANGDITISGSKYRRIQKLEATYTSSSSSYYNWSDSTTYHYFKYEPVKWRVLNVNGNDAFLLADKALDDQKYNTSYTSVTWETSTIRSWLNGYDASSNAYGTDYSSKNFMDTAFGSSEQSAIKNTSVINDNNLYYGTNGGNNTNDKVFLLSESEVYTDSATSYGFDSDESEYDKARRSKSSTYAKAMGTWPNTSTDYRGNCWWWLRSPGYIYADNGAYVDIDGFVIRGGNSVDNDCSAVRPALHLNLSSSNLYSYAGTVCSDGTENEEKYLNPITSVTKIQGTENHYYGVNSYKNTPEGDVYDDSVAFVNAMDNYLTQLRNATQKDIQTINKASKSSAQLLKEADAKTSDKIITMDVTVPDAAMNSVYETLAQYLDMYVETGVSLGKINMSASTIDISTSIVNKIRNNLDSLDFTRKVGNYTVNFKILKFMGSYTGSVTVQGNGRTYTGIIVSNSKETAKVLTTYINDMSEWVEDALYQSLKSIFTELADVTGISDFTKKEINALLKDKVKLLQNKGYGDLLTYCVAMRDGYDICQNIVASKDADDLTGTLKNAESIYNKIKKLDYSDEAVSNQVVATAMNKLNNAKNKLERSLYDYIYNTDNKDHNDNWWSNAWDSFKSFFIQCPVDFVIYDHKGNELGRVEDSEVVCTSDIYISVDGDVKTVVIPSSIDAHIEFIGTDTGDMNYVIEQTVDGKVTGRANYYNIPLSDGITYSQEVLGEKLTAENGSALISDNNIYNPSEYIPADKEDANVAISVECDGGTVIGEGKYAKGSPVVLTAYPDNEIVKFAGWYVDGNLVESDNIYRFAATKDMTVKAVFELKQEKDEKYYTTMSENYENLADILVYKSVDNLNDVVINMAGIDNLESLNVILKEYDNEYKLIGNVNCETEFDGNFRFKVSDIDLSNFSKVEVYNEKNELLGTIKSVDAPEEAKNMEEIDLEVMLSATEFTYDGMEKKPTVTIKDGDKVLENEKDYTVSYSNNTKVGTASVVIMGKGDYTGTITKTFTIVQPKPEETTTTSNPEQTTVPLKSEETTSKISTSNGTTAVVGNDKETKDIVVKKPKTSKIKKIKKTKKSLKITWKKVKGVNGYQIQYSTSSKFKKAKKITIKKAKITSKTIKKLKAKKKYYVRIRTYITVNGKKKYSDWSKKKSQKTK